MMLAAAEANYADELDKTPYVETPKPKHWPPPRLLSKIPATCGVQPPFVADIAILLPRDCYFGVGTVRLSVLCQTIGARVSVLVALTVPRPILAASYNINVPSC